MGSAKAAEQHQSRGIATTLRYGLMVHAYYRITALDNLYRQRSAWCRWAAVSGCGVASLQRLQARFGSLSAAWEAPIDDLKQRGGLARHQIRALVAARGKPATAPPQRLLTPLDPALPDALRQLERPPLQLFWSGKGSTWAYLRQRQAVAVVGSRCASDHAVAWAERLGRQLAIAGWPVVSGLASGIDAAAHRGCVAGNGRPVGVLATSLQRSYPEDNRALQDRISRTGLLLTEQSPGQGINRGHFATRNRLLVGLVRALVVVECSRRSGALIAAQLAKASGLPVWCVPADAGRTSAEGSNQLLQNGAALLLRPEELCQTLGPGPLPATTGEANAPAVATKSRVGRQLLEQLSEPHTLEQLQGSVAADEQRTLLTQLLQLQAKGLIRSLPGLRWVVA